MSKVHDLKCWPQFFGSILNWEKLFEIRHNDRDFHVGDVLWFREWNPASREYTGQSARRRICYMVDHSAVTGLADGYVCMGLDLEDRGVRSPLARTEEQSAKPATEKSANP